MSEGQTIKVRYSCFKCRLANREVEVPARRYHNENIKTWLEMVIARTAADHNKISPGCEPDRLYNLMIPVTEGASFIGQAEKPHGPQRRD